VKERSNQINTLVVEKTKESGTVPPKWSEVATAYAELATVLEQNTLSSGTMSSEDPVKSNGTTSSEEQLNDPEASDP
jgi:hypothetical protein